MNTKQKVSAAVVLGLVFVVLALRSLGTGTDNRLTEEFANPTQDSELVSSEPGHTKLVPDTIVDSSKKQQQTDPQSPDFRISLPMRIRDTRDPVAATAFETANSNEQPYYPLADAANSGSSGAAYLLHKLLRSCRTTSRTEEELDSAIEDLYVRRVSPSGTSESPLDDHDSPARVEALLRVKFERCRNVTEEMTGEAENWLKKSASLGNSLAKVEYGKILLESDPLLAAEHYRAMWDEDGMAHGAEGLSKLYLSGWPGQSVDPVLSAAFFLISTEFTLRKYRNDPEHPFADDISSYLTDKRATTLGQLSPHEYYEAIKVAAREIEQNHQCCQ